MLQDHCQILATAVKPLLSLALIFPSHPSDLFPFLSNLQAACAWLSHETKGAPVIHSELRCEQQRNLCCVKSLKCGALLEQVLWFIYHCCFQTCKIAKRAPKNTACSQVTYCEILCISAQGLCPLPATCLHQNEAAGRMADEDFQDGTECCTYLNWHDGKKPGNWWLKFTSKHNFNCSVIMTFWEGREGGRETSLLWDHTSLVKSLVRFQVQVQETKHRPYEQWISDTAGKSLTRLMPQPQSSTYVPNFDSSPLPNKSIHQKLSTRRRKIPARNLTIFCLVFWKKKKTLIIEKAGIPGTKQHDAIMEYNQESRMAVKPWFSSS